MAVLVMKEHAGSDYAFMLEQLIAQTLIEEIAGYDAATPESKRTSTLLTEEEREALGIAAELLVKHENPNADYVYVALSAQKGHWDASKIQQLRKAAYEDASVWLNEDCTSCSKVQDVQFENAASQRATAVQRGLTQLETL